MVLQSTVRQHAIKTKRCGVAFTSKPLECGATEHMGGASMHVHAHAYCFYAQQLCYSGGHQMQETPAAHSAAVAEARAAETREAKPPVAPVAG